MKTTAVIVTRKQKQKKKELIIGISSISLHLGGISFALSQPQ